MCKQAGYEIKQAKYESHVPVPRRCLAVVVAELVVDPLRQRVRDLGVQFRLGPAPDERVVHLDLVIPAIQHNANLQACADDTNV